MSGFGIDPNVGKKINAAQAGELAKVEHDLREQQAKARGLFPIRANAFEVRLAKMVGVIAVGLVVAAIVLSVLF